MTEPQKLLSQYSVFPACVEPRLRSHLNRAWWLPAIPGPPEDGGWRLRHSRSASGVESLSKTGGVGRGRGETPGLSLFKAQPTLEDGDSTLSQDPAWGLDSNPSPTHPVSEAAKLNNALVMRCCHLVVLRGTALSFPQRKPYLQDKSIRKGKRTVSGSQVKSTD